ncbi:MULTISPECIES: COG3650 family protein [Nostocales]|uniref:Uncharacterized protein n=3 Tax=Nostocales TaxID=1161 RepID=A0A0C1QZL0_9CYAN|nr:hypothetical protein [Tolypothrix bouteillei]KAF3885327.1 hypothetical protein DA73_0400007540 [Tolypothrix bouteillei VB521301]
MKILISGVLFLGLTSPFLASARSVANQSTLSIKNNHHYISQNAVAERFNVVGTEPFWNVSVSKSGIVYSSPEVKKQTFPYVAPLKAAGRPDDLVRVYQLKGKGNNTLILKKVDKCSDGMSDKDYPYSATLILGTKVLEGCAEKK